MNNWNVVIRYPDQPHFTPVWNRGIYEDAARNTYREYSIDPYTRDQGVEYQLVTDFEAHYVWEPVTVRPGNTRMQRKLVVDGWRGVPVP